MIAAEQVELIAFVQDTANKALGEGARLGLEGVRAQVEALLASYAVMASQMEGLSLTAYQLYRGKAQAARELLEIVDHCLSELGVRR